MISIAEHLYVRSRKKAWYLEVDHLNPPLAARDQTGKVIWQWASDAFGSVLPNEDPDGDTQKTTINLRFAGQYSDKESGLHYNHRRYYDPKLGRYLSPDPIGLAGGGNLYGYVENNPLSNVDPLGLFNPAKGASAFGNAAIAGWSAASGGLKLAIATGLAPAAATGVGALPPTALAAWGAWNLKASAAAWQRSQQQWKEAQCEGASQATWKNFYGMAPGGTHYDDPGKATGPSDYIQSRGWWKFLVEAGYF